MDENYEINYDNKDVKYNGLSHYINETRKIPLLSAEQEKELFIEMKNGSSKARQKLIESNLRLVISIAKSYKNCYSQVSFDDFLAEGNYALIIAVDRFDINKGVKFSSYAVKCIENQLIKFLNLRKYCVYVPLPEYDTLRRMNKVIYDYYSAHGKYPSDEYLIRKLHITDEKFKNLKALTPNPISLNEIVSEDNDTELLNIVPDKSVSPLDEELMSNELRQLINRVLDIVVTPNQAFVIRKYYGLEDGKCLTLEKIAALQNCKTETVRQRRNKAIKRIKKSTYYEQLKTFYIDTDNILNKDNILNLNKEKNKLNSGRKQALVLFELSFEFFSILFPDYVDKMKNNNITRKEFLDILKLKLDISEFFKSIISNECILDAFFNKIDKKALVEIKNKVLEIKFVDDELLLDDLQKNILCLKLGHYNGKSYSNSSICDLLELSNDKFLRLYGSAINKIYKNYLLINSKENEKSKTNIKVIT